jgi:hypothetical protein
MLGGSGRDYIVMWGGGMIPEDLGWEGGRFMERRGDWETMPNTLKQR